MREIELQTRCQDVTRHIVKIKEHIRDEDFNYIVMEFMAGGNLYQYPYLYNEENMRWIIKQIARALKCLH